MVHQSAESNRLCLEFLRETERGAEKIFGTDTQPMDWVVHELNKIHEANNADRAREKLELLANPPTLRAGGGAQEVNYTKERSP